MACEAKEIHDAVSVRAVVEFLEYGEPIITTVLNIAHAVHGVIFWGCV